MAYLLLSFAMSIFALASLGEVRALQILMLDIPSPTFVGESVELSCSYDLEGVNLYSVKWYKNGTEFFRYVPKNIPSIRVLPIPGIKVDVSRSNKKSVYLKHVDLNSEGLYKCEVSGEEPDFKTVEKEKEMKIYLLPKEGPTIKSSKPRMRVGDVVNLNCTSAKSKPVTTLEWFINDVLIDSRAGNGYEMAHQIKREKLGAEVSSLSIKFVVLKKHFVDGLMRLKCTANVGRLFTMSSSVEEIDFDYRYTEGENNAINVINSEMNRKEARNSSSSSVSRMSYQVILTVFIVKLFV